MIVSDGRPLGRRRDPPGQLSVYIPPGDTKREVYRLSTFEKYPAGSVMDPWTLVRAGFYYRGYKDRVQCHGCGMQVQDWEVGDNPRDAKWHEVTCKFDRHNPDENEATIEVRHPLTNFGPQIPVNRTAPPARRVLWQSPEVTVVTPRAIPAGQVLCPRNSHEASAGGPDSANWDIMFPCNNAYSPHMTSLESRLQTFIDRERNWSQVRVKATPKQMAEAGLFYLGDHDRVKCYYCNGGLQNWAFNDNPWFEHAKWFPLCEHVLRHKGPEYVERVTTRYAHLLRPHGNGSRPPLGREPRSSGEDPYADAVANLEGVIPGPPALWPVLTQHRPRECVDRPIITDPGEKRRQKQEQINKEMANSEVIQAAFELGFERCHIRRALSMRLDEYGRGFGKVETLVTYLLDQQVTGNLGEVTQKGEGTKPHTEESDITKAKKILEQDKCRVCQKEKARTVLLPCGHLVVCKTCGASISRCPVCRTKKTSSIEVFRA